MIYSNTFPIHILIFPSLHPDLNLHSFFFNILLGKKKPRQLITRTKKNDIRVICIYITRDQKKN